ncbi:MAG: TonB-dependent receptor [Crocinitomicaceae bacterium]
MTKKRLTTEEKALSINLDQSIYGSFAEIGAGQEVAATFFRIGGSSGTIAYTHSAYDMKISDSMYGKCSRYVCEDRLQQMLDKEFENLQKTIPQRAEQSRFFAFANTVESLNYHKTNQGQGWVGIKYQLEKGGKENQIILHVKMHDNSHQEQQKALGILGVNLIHAAYTKYEKITEFLSDLSYRLPKDKLEIDMCSVTGPDYEHVDNRLIALLLVKQGLTNATIFDQTGSVIQASDALYKKNIFLMRGRFRPVTKVHVDMVSTGLDAFLEDKNVDPERVQVLLELTLKDLTADGKISIKDFLDRADLLNSMGYTVMVSNYLKHYKMIEYLSDFAKGYKMGVVLGVYNLQSIFSERYYENLEGGLLEAFGRGFGRHVKMYVYPAINVESGELYTLDNFDLEPHLKGLLDYMAKTDKVAAITDYNSSLLTIFSDDVLAKIKADAKDWEEDVPVEVLKAIKFYKLFGYKGKQIKA